MKKVAVVGTGVVGRTLADGFLKHGYEVMCGSRDPAKLADWQASAGEHAHIGSPGEAAAWGDIVVLAVKGTAARAALALCDPVNLAGKVVIDTTNPIADEPPDNNVLRYFTDLDVSLMERLQELAPEARFVKAFSCTGSANMVDPDFGGPKPTMFICGNDDAAKAEVTEILTEFGWETEDMGGVESARAIEPLAILWCIPGFRSGDWEHAFKLLRT
ncbi:MAG: NAD(P)-binding domain-containing protein [Acidobacteriota bacterium]|jgi:predicted dinucleotide-binding enzyme